MKKLVSLLVAMIMALSCTAALAEIVNTEVVMPVFAPTESGEIVGFVQNGVYTFKGVPFGTAERFEPATPATPWEGVRTTLTEGYVAPQLKTTINNYDFTTYAGTDLVESEDCLNLNVWTTTMDTEAKRPVIVFFHGGGYTSGSSNELTVYDGTDLAKFGDIVFVSANHRLGQLSFLDLSAYGEEYKYSGNLMLTDMIRSLEWVRDNIATFGGDPNNVTIYGQSGGAGKVATLLASPAAKGLFHKAWMASGGGIGVSGLARADAQAATAKLVESLGLADKSNEEIVAALKAMPFDDLMTSAAAVRAGTGFVIDGELLPEKEVNALISKDIPVVTSSVITEFIGNGVNITGPRLMSKEQFLGYLLTSKTEDEVKADLTAKYGEYTDAIIAAWNKAYPGHSIVELPYVMQRGNATAIAKAEQGGAPVYQAVFAWTYPLFGGVGAAHTQGDFPLVFHTLGRVDWQIAGNEVEAYAVADVCAQALVNFMTTGDPSQEGVEWKPFTVENGETMIFDTVSETRNYHDKELWELINQANAK